MIFRTCTLDTCATASGLVVVIDVLRAFSTSAYLFACGAERILPVSTVEEARQYKRLHPSILTCGEIGGVRPPDFDLPNSPTHVLGRDLAGCTVVQRTTAGTQGIALSKNAGVMLAASFVVAGATARFIQSLRPESVTFVATSQGDDGGEDDLAFAGYLRACLLGEHPDPEPYLARVRRSDIARMLRDSGEPDLPESDIIYCTELDRFPFAMRVQQEGGEMTMRAVIL